MRHLPPVALALLVAVAAPGAAADTVRLADGKELVAVVLEERADGTLVVVAADGRRELAPGGVRSRTPAKDPKPDFDRVRRAVHGRGDAEALVDLADWAGRQGKPAWRADTLALALDADPKNRRANEALGRVLVGDRWVEASDAAAGGGGAPDAGRAKEVLAERYARLLGARPDVVVTAHYECADLLEDGRAAARLADLESAWTAARGVLGSDPWSGRALVLALRGEEQYRKWVDAEGAGLRGMNAPLLEFVRKATGMKWYDPKILARSNLPDAGAMHAANVHGAGHLAVCVWKRIHWKAPFWIEEGFGGWMEQRILGSNTSYCFDIPAKAGYGGRVRGAEAWDVALPDWKRLLKQAVAGGAYLPLEDLDRLPRGEYSRREVAQSFALVTFLLEEKEHEKWRTYLSLVKGGTPSADAVKQAYGLVWNQIEPEWKRFVADRW